MQARELVELAAVIVAQAPALITGEGCLSPSCLDQYWAATRCRHDRWNRTFASYRPGTEPNCGKRSPDSYLATLEEILASEVLARVWTAVLVAYDQRRGLCESEPVGRSVFLAHVGARIRVLELMVRGSGLPLQEAVTLNQLRRKTERWIDLLIGQLLTIHDVSEFAIDPLRARDFADDFRDEARQQRRTSWQLLTASLRTALQDNCQLASPNVDLNQRIASAIMASFSGELFDSTGVFQSLWLVRMRNQSQDVQGLIAQLLAPQPTSRGDSSIGRRRID